MKESLEKKFVEQTITEEELGEYKKSLWIKKGIISGIYLFMMIFSFIYIKRIGVFFNALGGGGFSFYAVAIVIFYITLTLAFGYFIFQIGYMIYSQIKGLDWVALITKLNIKLDIYSFICKCLSILLFIMIYITTPCTVVGSSMDPTFKDGDRLLCTDLFYTPTRGDIIVFDAQNYTELDSFFIKRTIAIEGDIIKLGGPDMNEVSINNQ
ncbi:MAG: signal peptidase I, partial [Acholeplasmatales bacterium]|nr:signal peptidase I [Acholeplasmatales bacterium]